MSTPAETILRAAAMAEQAAAAASQGTRTIRIEGGTDGTGEGWSQLSIDFGPAANPGTGPGCMLGDTLDGELATGDAALIVASGPDFWRALAATLRAVNDTHRESAVWAGCVQDSKPTPCATVLAILPLAERIIRDLEWAAEAMRPTPNGPA